MNIENARCQKGAYIMELSVALSAISQLLDHNWCLFVRCYAFCFRLEDQAKNNDFHRFVEGHLIVKQGILYKKKGFFPKKRMFLLTEGPHLYYVDPDKMVLKGEIPWSPKLRTEIRDFRVFFVHVPGRTYYLVSGGFHKTGLLGIQNFRCHFS